jgi:UDP-N-acetylglucosamine 1-carboxyvinyltransferase
MPEKFLIKGNIPLSGELEISGYKNAAGACLAAVLLTKESVVLDNLPLIEDVFKLLKVLESIGVQTTWLDVHKIKLTAGENLDVSKMEFRSVESTRVSVLLMGSLLTRFSAFKFPHPGGDRIGVRPITAHLDALKKLGAEIEAENGFYSFRVKELKGKEIILKEFSVTATENTIMAAVRAKGKTIIKGAAAEPQICDLGNMLIKMGAKIEGLGSHTITIEGVDELHGTEHRIMPDLLEVGTFVAVSAITPGEVTIKNINIDDLDIFLDKIEEIGVDFERGENCIKVRYSPNLKAVRIQALPWPGFPTDMLPMLIPLLTQAEGKSLIHDPLYENRFNYVQELRKMGADIEIVDPHRAFIYGKTPLKGLNIESWDIRAGASLIIAALLAEGDTVIDNIQQIDRGYEKIEEKLKKLGADIERLK